MKKLQMIILCMSVSICFSLAQNDAYVKTMEENVKTLESKDMSLSEYQNLANNFERISASNAKEWLPDYFASYCYVMMAFKVEDSKTMDLYSDQAEVLCEKITEKGIENDELYVLKAYVAQAKLSADPGSRWMKEGAAFKRNLEKAEKLNPENPRIHLLKGSNIYYTPKNFGGGKETAYPLLKVAEEKFASFKPASSIAPDWGRPYLKILLKLCETTE